MTGFLQAEVITSETELEPEEEEVDWQEGDIRYEGDIYRYNDDILTFMFLGIDKMQEAQTVGDETKGGQSDAIFLLVLNPHSEQVSILAIPRDTIADVDVYSKEGTYLGVVQAQLTLQHAYGDGGKLSCERTQTAVSRLLYDLPINGYCSINMGGIPLLNDAIGGVEVTALQDVIKSNIKKGDQILLKGNDAYAYVHNRDLSEFASAEDRLARQKQYITAYLTKAKAAMKEDITLPVKLYSTLSKYMFTDISVDEVSYLATRMGDYSFNGDNIHTIKGVVEQEGEHEGFYVDEQELYELILELFYDKIST